MRASNSFAVLTAALAPGAAGLALPAEAQAPAGIAPTAPYRQPKEDGFPFKRLLYGVSTRDGVDKSGAVFALSPRIPAAAPAGSAP